MSESGEHWAASETIEMLQRENADLRAELEQQLAGRRCETCRTLTLPNGVEVRAEDVLVAKSYISCSPVAKVIWIGRQVIVARQLGTVVGNEYTPTGLLREFMLTNSQREDWRPWSEVYPDRPVPGAALTAAFAAEQRCCGTCAAYDEGSEDDRYHDCVKKAGLHPSREQPACDDWESNPALAAAPPDYDPWIDEPLTDEEREKLRAVRLDDPAQPWPEPAETGGDDE